MHTKTKRGFTLIELLVVIAIIGILSSVVLASLNTARLKSRDTRRVADIKQLQLALALYFDSCGQYPYTLLNGSCGQFNQALTPTYIAVLPTDPVTHALYSYAGLGSGPVCSSYHLGATLEDPNNQALSSDADETGGTKCAGSVIDFSGTDTSTLGIYDVTP